MTCMRLGRTVSLFLLLFLFCSCSGGDPEERAESPGQAEDRSGGMAVVALSGDPDVLNPLIRRTSVAGTVLAEVLDTLVELDEDLLFVPRIAGEWELAPDGLSVTYRLQPWQWEDGHPLTSEDVVRSFGLFKDEAIGAASSGFYRDVLEATAPDEATVVYRFGRRLPDPLARSSHAILPWHRVSGLDPGDVDRWPINQQPVASGPFRLVSWEHSESITLERNGAYSGTAAHLDRVQFRVIKEPAARILALEAGEVDFVSGVAPHDADRLRDRDDLQIKIVEGRQFYYLQWNCRNPHLVDASTRRALSLAVDRPRLIETLLRGYADPAVSPIARVSWNHADELEADPHDPAAARALLAEAGWKDGDGDGILERGGREFRLEIITRTGDPVRRDGSVIIMENLRAVGVEVEVRAMELAAGLDLVRDGKFDVYFGAMTPNLYGDPSSAVHSGAIDEYNYGFYSNQQVDALLDEALGQSDPDLAYPTWLGLQKILQADPPAAYLFSPRRLDVVARRIQDVRPHVLSPVNNLSEWWIAAEDRKYRTGGP